MTGSAGGDFKLPSPVRMASTALWVVGTLVFVAWQKSCPGLLLAALSLTAGGAFGNLYDRPVELLRPLWEL